MKRYLLMGVILCLPIVNAAWEIDENVTIEYNDTTFIWGYDNVNMSSLTFESPTGAPIINSFTLDIKSDTEHQVWTIINFSLPSKLVVYGNTTQDGTFRIAGIGGTYNVNGVFGSIDFSVTGPTASFIVPAGEQVITLTPLGSLTSGPRIAISGEYSSLNKSITTAVTLANSDGSGVIGAEALIIVKVFEPISGALIDMPTVTATAVDGVYKTWTNLTSSLTYGTWLITAQYYSLSAAQIVSVKNDISGDDTLQVEIAQSGVSAILPYLLGYVVVIGLLFTSYKTHAGLWGVIGFIFALIITLTSIHLEGASSALQYVGWALCLLSILSVFSSMKSGEP